MENQDLYKQKLEAKIAEWNAELDKLRAKSKGASADVQLDFDAKISEFQHKLDAGKAELARLSDQSSDAMDSLKEGLENAWAALSTACSDALEKMKK